MLAKELNQRVFLLPDQLMQNDLLLISLKHPRTDSKVLCVMDAFNQLYEIIRYGEEISSWFIGESVSDDGSFFFLTPADPLFFILPYADQQPGKYCPIEDLLMDENYPDTLHLSKCCSMEALRNIFDSKGIKLDYQESAGYTVFCYNKTKSLHWLQQKTKALAIKLASKDIDLSDGSKAAALKVDDDLKSEEECLVYSCHLLSEYLSDNMSKELFSSLGLQQNTPVKEKNVLEVKLKKQNTSIRPEDDYSKNFNSNTLQEKQKKKLTVTQKQLMKVDKTGMKTISSFFQKK